MILSVLRHLQQCRGALCRVCFSKDLSISMCKKLEREDLKGTRIGTMIPEDLDDLGAVHVQENRQVPLLESTEFQRVYPSYRVHT